MDKKIWMPLGLGLAGGLLAFGAVKTMETVAGSGWMPLHAPVQTVANVPGITSSTDFSAAAENAVHSVVHVKTSVEQGYYFNPFRDFFFGFGEQAPQMTPRIVQGSGSGVVISKDGYIVTNNHVIDKAKEVRVSLNDNREYVAEVVGTDPTTDLAVLKIKADNLQPLAFGNSDLLRLGEWVMAVGNPFNLTSTVTAGIISAKGRSINIIDNQSAIEAFIQTDAAVNPGNSGGALINTMGELVGINTAISTRTGSYEGYSFAVPVNIVSKVVDDLTRYGMVQRAYLGVTLSDLTPELTKEMNLNVTQGAFLTDVVAGGAAEKAGLQRGDVVVRSGSKTVTRMNELLEVVGAKRPGDKLTVTVLRDGKSRDFELTLRNREGNTDLVKKDDMTAVSSLGARFEPLTAEEKRNLGLRAGVKITDPGTGKLRRAGVPAGFVLVKLNNVLVNTVEDVQKIIGPLKPGDGILLQGYRPDGGADFYAFGL